VLARLLRDLARWAASKGLFVHMDVHPNQASRNGAVEEALRATRPLG
jgi:hypothetical protein